MKNNFYFFCGVTAFFGALGASDDGSLVLLSRDNNIGFGRKPIVCLFSKTQTILEKQVCGLPREVRANGHHEKPSQRHADDDAGRGA